MLNVVWVEKSETFCVIVVVELDTLLKTTSKLLHEVLMDEWIKGRTRVLQKYVSKFLLLPL